MLNEHSGGCLIVAQNSQMEWREMMDISNNAHVCPLIEQ